MLTSYEQSSTLKRHAPNVFRFQADASQWAGGAGTYAVQKLGWKRIATVAEGDPSGWPTTSGFDVEVCALGGRIVHPQWPFSLEDQGTLVDKLHHDDLDGVFLEGAQGTGSFIEKWRALYPHLGRHLIVGWLPLFHSRAQLVGVVGVSPDPFRPTPAWNSYLHRFRSNFGHLRDPDFLNQAYYDGMAPVLQALEQVGGDVSDGQRRLMAALTHLDYHAPEGDITLDSHNQGIVPVYLGKVVRNAAGHTVIKQIAVMKVDQSFGGHLTASTPAPSARQPPCTRGNPPPWAR
jgi:branched-chain amino acid transport system substrate-binding protein